MVEPREWHGGTFPVRLGTGAPPKDLRRHYLRQGYQIGGEIGRGRHGIVHAGVHVSTGIPVALKRLRSIDGDSLYALKKEFRTLTEGNHPGIALAYELVADPQEPFIAMELVDGPTAPAWARLEDDESRVVARTIQLITQLAETLSWLHRRGRVHRDIKPSNVRMLGERAVLLDFDLSAVVGRTRYGTPAVAGTRPYMANEVLWQGTTSTATDVFSLGVFAYECLVGTVPFASTDDVALFREKSRGLPELPSFVPSWFGHLVHAMTNPDPDRRPTCQAVLDALAGESEGPQGAVFPELDGARDSATTLFEMYQGRPLDRPSVFFVTGPADAGKTAAVRGFLDLAESEPGCRILEGRCLPMATVAFQGLDGVVDSLADSFSDGSVSLDLQRRPDELLELFPGLARLPGFEVARPPQRSSDGAIERRRRALESLRELLVQLASNVELVVFVDDLQWADSVSLSFWADLLATPSRIVFVASSRDRAVLQRLQLAEGQPVEELALSERFRDAQAPYDLVEPGSDAASLLEASCVAFESLDLATLARCLELTDPGTAAATLIRSGLISQPRLDPRMKIAPRTTGIRRAVQDGLAQARIEELHKRLADTLASQPDHRMAVACFWHLCSARDPATAVEFAFTAGDRLMGRLAFEDAAAVYQAALRFATDAEVHELMSKAAQALERSGKGKAAGEAYLMAAQVADERLDGEAARTQRRRAAECLLRSGQVEAGNQVLDALLAGLPAPPASSLGLMLVLARERILGALSGLLPFVPGGSRLRSRLDDLWVATVGTVWSDLPRSMFYQVLHANAARSSTDVRHIARAIGTDGCYLAAMSPGVFGSLAEHLGDRSVKIAQGLDDPELLAMARCTATATSFLRGEWREAARKAHEIVRLVEEECVASDWELLTAYIYCSWSLGFSGDLAGVEALRTKVLSRARAHDDQLALTCVSVGLPNLTWLARGRPDMARASASESLGRWRNLTYSPFDFFGLFGNVLVDLYLGEPGSARARYESEIHRFKKSFLKYHPVLRPLQDYLNVITSLASLSRETKSATIRTRRWSAARSILRLATKRPRWCRALLAASRAVWHSAGGRRHKTLRWLERAEVLFRAAEMDLYAQAARHHIELTEGEGRSGFTLEVSDPDSLAYCLIPVRRAVDLDV